MREINILFPDLGNVGSTERKGMLSLVRTYSWRGRFSRELRNVLNGKKSFSTFSDISPGAGSTGASAARNASADSVYVVTGASRGIGLEFARQMLERSRGRVVALCRDPQGSAGLCDLESSGGERLHTLPLDLESQASVDAVPEALKGLGLNRVDLLLNVAVSCCCCWPLAVFTSLFVRADATRDS